LKLALNLFGAFFLYKMSKLPSFLSKNDLVVVISPSGVVDRNRVNQGIEWLEYTGFQVEISPNTFKDHFKFGGTHQERLDDLQYALDHPKARAIYCTRGGFGITHIIDSLDWAQFKKNPKWIIGFSDITALLHASYLNGFASLHGSVLQGLTKLPDIYKKSIIESLSGDLKNIEGASIYHKIGSSKGELIGGNLSLLVHQIGTATELDYSGKILFIEEVAEPLYHIDRMMLQLKRANILRGLAGLVIGQFSNLSEDKSIFGQSVEELILAHCKEYGFPIGFNFPFGHGNENMALVHGSAVALEVEARGARVIYV